MNTKSKIAAVSLSAVALVGVVGVGISYADDPTTSPSPTTSTPADQQPKKQHPKKEGDHAKRALEKRALHGEVTLGGAKKTRVVDFQRGTVEKVSDTSITVRSVDGFRGTYVVNGDTRVRQAGAQGTIADVKTGDTVRVVAAKDGKSSTAKVIREPKG